MCNFSVTEAQIIESEDGALHTDGNGHFIMFYNEAKPQTRQRFTAGHETGHHMLGHDMELISSYRQTKDKRFEPLYNKCEAESNMFAAELLMPEPVIIEIFKRGCKISRPFLKSIFNVSEEAAKVRMNTVRKVYSWECFRKYKAEYSVSYDDILLQKFKTFIDKIAPLQFSYIGEYEREEEMEGERQSLN